jgi:ABC-type dipeptide/oligopeptide/nickel transport system permease component
MLTYAIKRVLLMIPTFFAISLLVFVMLNIGAGDPGA